MKNVSRSSSLMYLLGCSRSTSLIAFFPFVTWIGFLLKDVQPQLLVLYIVAGVSKSTAHSDSQQPSQQSLGSVICSTVSTERGCSAVSSVRSPTGKMIESLPFLPGLSGGKELAAYSCEGSQLLYQLLGFFIGS